MQLRPAAAALVLLVSWSQYSKVGHAAVVVLANRTAQEVRFSIAPAEGKSRSYKIAKGEVKALPLRAGDDILFAAGKSQQRCRVRLNEIYYFLGDAAKLRLTQVGFSGSWRQSPQPEQRSQADPGGKEGQPPRAENAGRDGILLKIPVKIFVDQAEPTVQKVWEERLRKRIKSASDILESYCRTRLEVVDAGTWESDGSLETLSELLRDFRSKASPGKARLAIGFTGLRPEKSDDTTLGCTPGPLHAHILLREYKLRSEAERLEVLVHEVGHFLGAAHSPEGDSVMRPKLGDGRVNRRAFRLGFDPVNTLIMNLIAEELARGPVRGLAELSAPTRRRLVEIFSTLARSMPDDPAATYYVRLLGATPPEPWPLRTLSDEAMDGARSVVSAITANARRDLRRRSGDELTEHYFRLAAAQCRKLPAEDIATAYTLGLAIALDRESLLRSLPLRGITWTKIESDVERGQRLQVLGQPTMQGRASLLRSFLTSAAVPMLVEGQNVSPGALQEELLLLRGGDHFRFDDLAAGLAGTAFAAQLETSPTLLDELAKSFRIGDYLLAPKELPAPLDHDAFNRQFGSTTDKRFVEKQDALRKRLMTLPGFKPRPPRKDG